MNSALLAALVAAIIGPLFAYLAAAKKLSGKIETSEASDLWEEAARLRQEYKEEIAQLRKEIQDCADNVRNLKKKNQLLEEEVRKLKDAL